MAMEVLLDRANDSEPVYLSDISRIRLLLAESANVCPESTFFMACSLLPELEGADG
jgi:hypothetical protein